MLRVKGRTFIYYASIVELLIKMLIADPDSLMTMLNSLSILEDVVCTIQIEAA